MIDAGALTEPFGFMARRSRDKRGYYLAPFAVTTYGRRIDADCTFVGNDGSIEPITRYNPQAYLAAVALAQEICCR